MTCLASYLRKSYQLLHFYHLCFTCVILLNLCRKWQARTKKEAFEPRPIRWSGCSSLKRLQRRRQPSVRFYYALSLLLKESVHSLKESSSHLSKFNVESKRIFSYATLPACFWWKANPLKATSARFKRGSSREHKKNSLLIHFQLALSEIHQS